MIRTARLFLVAPTLVLLAAPPAHGQFHEVDPEAMKAFAELLESYRDRPALTVKTTVKIELLDGDVKSQGPEVEVEFTFGKGRVGVGTIRGFTCYLANGHVWAVHESNNHSYFHVADDGSPYYALMSAFIDIPFPHLAIAFGEEDAEEVCMQFHQKAPWVRPTSVSTEERDGKTLQHIKLTSDLETIDVVVDPETRLIQSVEVLISGGPFVQPGTSMIYHHSFTYVTHEKPLDKAVFEFDPGDRQPVDMLAALIERPPPGAPGGPRPRQAHLVGKAAPELLLATAGGEAIDLEALRGQVVVLDFWATWCGPCRTALPWLHEVAAWAQQGELPVTIVTVNTMEIMDEQRDSPDERLAAVRNFWHQKGFTLPVAMDYSDEVAADYGVQGIPATFVIRADGIVHAQHIGADPEYVAILKTDITEAIEALEAAP